MTTIAWRIGHLGGLALGGFANRRFGDGTLTPEGLDFPAQAAAVNDFVTEHYGAWREGLAGLDQPGWDEPLGPSWGPFSEANTIDLALHVLDEMIHHGAEVGVLRDFWAAGVR